MQDQMPQNDMNSMPDQGTDREGAMAKADLYKLANYSLKLFKQIQDEDQLEGWVQAKVTKAADYIASVYHYLEYEMKFSDYGDQLDNAGMYSEGQKAALKNKLMEAKEKVKELKKAQAKKADAKEDKKVSEGILSGGDESCTECGGTGMVYREATPVPDHVKNKVEKYNRQATAFHAASKRIDRNKNGIPDDMENDQPVDEETSSTGGEITRPKKGVTKHTQNTNRFSDEEHTEPKSKAKAQSSADKAGDKAADKAEEKEGKNWAKRFGKDSVTRVKDGKKVDPNAKKEKEVDETYGQGIYEGTDKDELPSMAHIKKMCKDGKSVAEICKMHPNCDQKALKQMVADCKGKMDEGNEPKDKPRNGEKIGKEGNAFGKAVRDAKASGDKTVTVGGKTMPVKEASNKSGKKVKETTAAAPAPTSAMDKAKAIGSAMAPGVKKAALTFGAMKALGVKETAISGAPQKSGIPATAKTTVPGMRATQQDLKKAGASAALGEEAYNEKEEQKHAAKTTMKHVNASDASPKEKAAIKNASKDIKPGSYKDRADALKAANVKEAVTVPSSPDGATAPPPKGKDGQYPVITSGPNKGKRWTDKAPGPTNPAFKESVNESADLNRMKELMARLNG